MNNIGNIISKYRCKLGMTRRDLSEDICSEKYLYLIEKGERSPSSNITRLLGDRMNVDLFSYYEYLDCLDPISTASLIEKFKKHRSQADFYKLSEINDEAMKLHDFMEKPWIYEIELNSLCRSVFQEGKIDDSIDKIQDIIFDMKENCPYSICLVNYYVLLSTCYQMVMDLKNAEKAVVAGSKIIVGKEKHRKYIPEVVTFKINRISLYYLKEKFDEVITEGLILNKYEEESCCCERSHHTFFYLAFAYYQVGLEEEGLTWFIKALCAALIKYRPKDMQYLTNYEMFNVIKADKRVSRDLLNHFEKKYDIK